MINTFSLRQLLIITGIIPYLILFACWPFYLDIRIHESVGINPERLVLIWVCVLWIMLLLTDKHYLTHAINKTLEYKWIFIVVLVFISSRLLSLMQSDDVFYSSLLFINELITNYLLMYIVFLTIKTKKELYLILKVLFYCLIGVSIFTIIESIFEYNIFTGLTEGVSKSSMIAKTVKMRDGVYRAQAIFEHPLSLAQYLVFLLPVLLFSNILRLNVTIRLLSVGLVLFALILTMTRTSFVVLSLIIFLYVFHYIWNIKIYNYSQFFLKYIIYLILLIIFIPGGVVTGRVIIGSQGSEALSSSLTRIDQIMVGYALVKEKPFLGYGVGMAGELMLESSKSTPYVLHTDSIDNMYLKLVVESGIISLILFLVFLIAVVVTVWNNQSKTTDRCLKKFYLWGALSIVGFIVSMSVLAIFTVLPLLYLIIGVLLDYSSNSNSFKSRLIVKL